MKKLILSFTALLISMVCMAQLPEPAKELSDLNWMIGEWSGTGTFQVPNMGAMDVTVTFKAEWDGLFIKQTAINDFGMMKMTETMMLGYDETKSEFFSHGYTNMAPLPRMERGNMSNGSLVMTSEPWEVMGEASISRATLTKGDNDTVKMKLEFKAGDAWAPVADFTFTRKK